MISYRTPPHNVTMFVIVTFYEQQHEKLCVCALESRHSQSYYHLLYNVEQTNRIAQTNQSSDLSSIELWREISSWKLPVGVGSRKIKI